MKGNFTFKLESYEHGRVYSTYGIYRGLAFCLIYCFGSGT
jgi:hypothetical protein